MHAYFKTLKNLNGSQSIDDPKFQIASSTNSHSLTLYGRITKLDFEIYCTCKMLCFLYIKIWIDEWMKFMNGWMYNSFLRYPRTWDFTF